MINRLNTTKPKDCIHYVYITCPCNRKQTYASQVVLCTGALAHASWMFSSHIQTILEGAKTIYESREQETEACRQRELDTLEQCVQLVLAGTSSVSVYFL